MAIKNLTITEQEKERIRELLDEGLSGCKISKITGIPQAKIWRNLELLGWNKKKEHAPPPQSEIFKWSDFGNCII